MTWKSIFSVVAVVAMSATFANAQTYRVRDGGLGSNGRIFNVFVTPAVDNTSVALEFGIDLSGAINSNTSIASADVNDDVGGTGAAGDGPFNETLGVSPDEITVDNLGANPFTSTDTGQLVGDGTATTGMDVDQIFIPTGSGLLPSTPSTLAFSFEINDPIAVGEFVGSTIASTLNGKTAVTGTFGIYGDVDRDGVVGGIDFAEFGTNFGATMDPGNPFDIDGDGSVGGIDFAEFGARFGLNIANNGPGAVVSAAPEPAGVALLLFALSAVAGTRKRS